MRLSGIHRLLVELMSHLTQHHTGQRRLEIIVYCCAPEFLKTMEPHNLNTEHATQFKRLLEPQISTMINNINQLYLRKKQIDFINIHIRGYYSIPSFWAFEVDSEDIFWGYISWNEKELNWHGSQNQCCYFNKKNQPIKGMFEWVQNYINGLETWSVPIDTCDSSDEV